MKKRKLRNNKIEHRKRERELQYKDFTRQKDYDICHKKFGIIVDDRYSVKRNVIYLINTTTDLTYLPRKLNNLKCNNLCNNKESVSMEVLEILGLNIGFGVSMKLDTTTIPIDFNRLKRAVSLCFVKFGDKKEEEQYIEKLISKSDWEPPKAPKTVELTVKNYEIAVTTAFNNSWKQEHVVNLKEKQIKMLSKIKKEQKFIVNATDKNLGPAIMEIDYQIQRCLTDHLDQTNTYKELSEMDARISNEEKFCFICTHFIDNSNATITNQAHTFFIRECLRIKDKTNGVTWKKRSVTFPYIYMMPKVHKKPDWKTRPVVSGVTSIMRPLSICLNGMLQQVVHLCLFYLKDSWHLLNDLKTLKPMKGCKFVTSDADLFYTNINTAHAIEILEKWFKLHKHKLPPGFPVQLILIEIRCLMENNVFTIESRFFVQTNGTAMGTNDACMYATIYYSYHEETELRLLPYNRFYRRLIDDALIIVDEIAPYINLKNNMNNFGPIEKHLTWTTEKLSSTVNFLDLTLTIQKSRNHHLQTFQKPDNYFLYRTPDSCQPANILTSFIYSTLQRYYHQNTFIKDYNHFTEFLFHNMLKRGHINHSLNEIFVTQSEKAQKSKMPHITRTPQE